MTWVIVIMSATLVWLASLVALFNRRYKAEKELRENSERRERLATSDNDALLKYMADANELRGVHKDDYINYKTTDNKHNVVAGVLDRLYGVRHK